MSNNPLIVGKGNTCINCKHEFVYSMFSFDVIPLVEFYPEDDISDEEAKKLIEREPPVGRTRRQHNVNAQTLSLDQDNTFENDLFGSVMDQFIVRYNLSKPI
jgi:intraflagellar transport protein 122